MASLQTVDVRILLDGRICGKPRNMRRFTSPLTVDRSIVGISCQFGEVPVASVCSTRRSEGQQWVVASVRWTEQRSFKRSSTANGVSRAREILQSAIDKPLLLQALPRCDDRSVAETVNSPTARHRQQRLPCSHSAIEGAWLIPIDTNPSSKQLTQTREHCDSVCRRPMSK